MIETDQTYDVTKTCQSNQYFEFYPFRRDAAAI